MPIRDGSLWPSHRFTNWKIEAYTVNALDMNLNLRSDQNIYPFEVYYLVYKLFRVNYDELHKVKKA